MSLIEIAAQLLIEGTEYVCDSLIYRFGLRLYQSFGGKTPDEFKAMIWALGITGWITVTAGAIVFVLWLLEPTNP
jgi:hypothetical protein